jgi:hypothetical protein
MKKTILTTVGLALLALTPIAASQDLADFGIPASSDNPDAVRQVKAPGAVTEVTNKALGKPVVSGATTQDAVNAAVGKMVDSGETAYFIATSAGLGVVTVGYGSYTSNLKNPNLVLIEQRQAFLEAMLEAKVEMVTFLGGISIAGLQEMHKQSEMRDAPEGSLANTSKATTEQLSESTAGMLRGVIVYDIKDDPENGEVMVTVITTPKTQGAVQSVGGGTITATSLAAGLEAVFTEIKSGLIAPEGGRIVAVPGTGEIAWVGFGSEINRKNRTPSVQRTLRSEARDTAQMRARKALLAVINGEDVNKTADLNASYSKQTKQFENVITAEGNEEILTLAQDKVEILATQAKTRAMGSKTVGQLPAGVSMKTYVSSDGNWSYAVALYFAKATDAAGQLADTMKANSPLGGGKANFQIEPDGSFKVGSDGRLIPASMGNGRVTSDKDLDIID